MDGVCQKDVVVADLERIATFVAVRQESEIPAVLLSAIAGLGNADTVPVVAAEMRGPVYVQLLSER